MKRRLFDFGYYSIGDVFDSWYGSAPMSLSYGKVYNPETHELTPRKEYIEAEIKRKEEELESNERAKESSLQYYENRKKQILEEKEKLVLQRGKLSP